MKCEVRWINSKISDKFYNLKDERLTVSINKALDLIEIDHSSGIYIPKRLIPNRWKVENLCKMNLPNGWRLLFTKVSDEKSITAYILDFMNHKQYCRLFKY